MANQTQRFGPVLTVLSAAAFMASLDVFIVNVAFDDIGRDFHLVGLSDLSWVLNAYAILYAALLGVGSVVLALSVHQSPHYATQILPGWLLGGAGVGLALPAILSSATADLPPAQAATGSAVVTMSRQVGTALGVSLFVAVVGAPVGYAAAHAGFQHAWWAMAAVGALAALTAPAMSPRRHPPTDQRTTQAPLLAQAGGPA